MSLQKVIYQNGVTVIMADNLNDIQDAIIDLQESGGGDVSSVNGKTGAVTLNASDVGAVAANQGTGNAGKFLTVGNDGIVAPVTMQVWQAGSY